MKSALAEAASNTKNAAVSNMNVEIISTNPFVVSFRLYNLLGSVDGHPKVVFDMKSGNYKLTHDKGFANLVSMAEHPLKGQEIELPVDDPMRDIIQKQIDRRIKSTGFSHPEQTVALNKYYEGNPEYPSYYFTMAEDITLVIGQKEYVDIRKALTM